MVTSTHTEAISFFRGIMADWQGLRGGKSDLLNKKLDDVMDELVKGLTKGLNSDERIVGAQFAFTEFGRTQQNSFLSGVATGTVVRRRSQAGAGRKLRRTRRRN